MVRSTGNLSSTCKVLNKVACGPRPIYDFCMICTSQVLPAAVHHCSARKLEVRERENYATGRTLTNHKHHVYDDSPGHIIKTKLYLAVVLQYNYIVYRFAMVCGGLHAFLWFPKILVVICGALGLRHPVCGHLQWFVVVCGGL